MSDKNREVLSSLMDGEWNDIDPARGVEEASASEEQKAVWARYHLARDAMRGESVDSSFSIASAVSAAIADEPAYTNVTAISSASQSANIDQTNAAPAAAPSRGSRWGMGAAGLAVAASAALATVIGLDYLQSVPESNAPAMVASSGAAPAVVPNLPGELQQSQVDLVSNRGSYWVSGQSGQRVGAEMRLNQLLGDHIEHSPAGDWQGMLPYSRLVGYDTPANAGQ